LSFVFKINTHVRNLLVCIEYTNPRPSSIGTSMVTDASPSFMRHRPSGGGGQIAPKLREKTARALTELVALLTPLLFIQLFDHAEWQNETNLLRSCYVVPVNG
jgi:hypothetical protein